MRQILLSISLVAIVGCGGGGGSLSSETATALPDTSPTAITATTTFNTAAGLNYSSMLMPAKFDTVGGKYVVVSGIYLAGGNPASAPTPNPDAPIRILKINSDGTSADVPSCLFHRSCCICSFYRPRFLFCFEDVFRRRAWCTAPTWFLGSSRSP